MGAKRQNGEDVSWTIRKENTPYFGLRTKLRPVSPFPHSGQLDIEAALRLMTGEAYLPLSQKEQTAALTALLYDTAAASEITLELRKKGSDNK